MFDLRGKSMPPGGVLAILGYIVLAAGVAFALYGVQVNQTNISEEICWKQNELRESMINVFEGQLPPLPTPEDAGPDVERTIMEFNQRNRNLVETFKKEVGPLNCDVVD